MASEPDPLHGEEGLSMCQHLSIPECWCDQSDLLVVNDGMEVDFKRLLLTRYGKLLYYVELVPKCLTC